MSSRLATLGTLFAAAALAGCGDTTHDLTRSEIQFLREDVLDLMTIAFQTGENGFVGDSVEPEDVGDPAGPGNNFTATYDLPFAARVGLGEGSGRVSLRVVEDGVPASDPIGFSFGTTAAGAVTLVYELRYDGETAGNRATDVDLTATLSATRTGGGGFLVEYFLDGEVFLGATFCELTCDFRAPGRPRDGVEVQSGDGLGIIDDPDVFAAFEYDIDWLAGEFLFEGPVSCCAFFEETFPYADAF
ncbi:MAG: hypothetical protein ACREID_08465 [Planctomycetota bacterium]